MLVDIILLLAFAAGSCILVSRHADSVVGKRNITSFQLWGGVLCGLLFICVAAFLVVNNFTTIGNADTVAYVSTNGMTNYRIYYDQSNDIYFTVRQNLWNIFEPSKREIIDNFTATEYINLINKIG